MKKSWLVVLSAVLLLAIVGLSGCYAGRSPLEEFSPEVRLNLGTQQEGIWVNGKGEVSLTPDIVTLTLGIASQAASIAEAQSQASQAMTKVMTALSDNGVAKKDIQTQHFSIRPVTKWDKIKEEEVVIGYRVTNLVVAKIRTIDKVGAIIDAVAAAGGDLTRIESIAFSVDDLTPYYAQARQKAMADAKAKAEQLAELSGVVLGKATYISESAYVPPPMPVPRPAMLEKGAMVETPISPGEMQISLNVQVVYAIRK